MGMLRRQGLLEFVGTRGGGGGEGMWRSTEWFYGGD